MEEKYEIIDDQLTAIVTGTIINKLEIRKTTKGMEYMYIKLKIRGIPKDYYLTVKIFDDETTQYSREICNKYRKGDRITVIGRPDVSSYIPKGKQDPVSELNIIPQKIKFIGRDKTFGKIFEMETLEIL